MAAERGKWVKGCESVTCVQVLIGSEAVFIATTHEDTGTVAVTHDEYAQFLTDVKAGKFDL